MAVLDSMLNGQNGLDLTHNDALMAEIEALKAENARLKASRPKGNVFLKVSEKGAVSMYGINSRMPVTLYKSQWLKVLDMAEQVKAFIEANDHALSQGKAS